MTRSHKLILLFLLLGPTLAGGAYLLSDRDAASAPQVATQDLSSDSPEITAAAPATAVDATTDAAQTSSGPTFDNVFIEPDGSGMIAGRAEPGSSVSVVIAGETVGEATADAGGAFAAFVAVPPSDASRVMTLVSTQGEVSVTSDATIMVPPMQAIAEIEDATAATETVASVLSIDDVTSPPSRNDAVDTTPEAAAALPGADTAGLTAPARGENPQITATLDSPTTIAPSAVAISAVPDSGSQGDTQTALAPSIGAIDTALTAPVTAPAEVQLPLLLADETGVRVLQPAVPRGADAEVLRTVALDTISYDTNGEVVVSGRLRGEGSVRVYLNNALIAETAASDGNWQMQLPDVDTGVYTMRVDQVSGDGSVTSRIETPFRRADRATLAAVLAEDLDGADVAVRTVQPGNTLWGISRDRYGEGTLYVEVFEANRDLIRDPDLIYPGQILRLPVSSETE